MKIKRLPRDNYFQHGLIHFLKKKGELMFQVWLWSKDGLKQIKDFKNRPVKDDQELEFLTTVRSEKKLTSHFSSTVIEN